MKLYVRISSLQFSVLIIIALIFTCFTSFAQWVKKAYAPQYRSDLSESIIYKSRLYTFLGFYDHDRHADSTSDAYDPASDTYTLLAPIPRNAMTHEKIVLIDSTVWLIGGRVGQNPGPLTSEVWIYNIATNSWYKGPQLKDPATHEPILFAAGGAALLGRTLHIFGGFIINACRHDQSIYHLTLDVDTWLADTAKDAAWQNNLTPLPIKRNHLSTVVLGGKIYAIGGQFGHDCGGGQEKPFSHVYDPATDTWTELPLLPNARSHAEGGTFAIDNKIYVVGGQDENGASTNKVTIFDPAGNNGTGAWSDDTTLTLPGKYEGGTAKIINSTFIYSHGGEGTSAKPRNVTFTRAVIRNPVYKFGFSSGCLKLSADSGTSVTGKTLLFTIDSSKNYLISSNVKWLTITKNARGIATPNAVDIEITAHTADLAPGNYSGTITAAGADSGTNFTEATYCITLTVKSSKPALQIFEAETAALNGVQVANDHTGYSGTGFANYINPTGDYIEWTVNKSTAGAVLLGFRYSNGNETDRPLQLSLNGVASDSSLSFPSTASWENWAVVTTVSNLKSGINTIRLTATGYSGPNIDYLSFTNDTEALMAQRTGSQKNIRTKSSYFFNPLASNGTFRKPRQVAGNLFYTSPITDLPGKGYKK